MIAHSIFLLLALTPPSSLPIMVPTTTPTTPVVSPVPGVPAAVTPPQPNKLIVTPLPAPVSPTTSSGWLSGLGSIVTAVLSVLAAVVTFVVGQFIQRLSIEPIQEHRRIIGRIINAVTSVRHDHVYRSSYDANPDAKAKLDAAAVMLRGLAADLRASVILIPLYRAWTWRRLVLPKADAWKVANHLLRWSTFGGKEPEKDVEIAYQGIIDTLRKTFGDAVKFGQEPTIR